MRALMNHTGEFRDLLKELGSAAGTVGVDLKRVLDDSQGSMDRMANSWERLKTSLGETIAPPAANVMDAVSGSLDRASAVNAGLEKTGAAKGWWARTGWGVTSSEAEKDSMAWVGGYRTEEQRAAIAGYDAYAKSRVAAPAFSVPRKSLPDVGPVVRTRDGGVIGATAPAPVRVPLDPTDVAITRSDASRGYTIESASAGVAQPDNLSVRPGSDLGDLHAMFDRFDDLYAKPAADLARGGEDAAAAISEVAPEAGNGFGDAAAARINASAAEAGTAFGDAAAARIRAAVGTVRQAGSGVGASGNMGRSMPAAGTTPGGS
jgi:hypothetical protein